MIDLTYTIFGFILLFKVFLFLLLSIPTPKKFRGKLIGLLVGSKFMSTLLWIDVGLCILAGIFYGDLMSTESLYTAQKDLMRSKGDGHAGSGNHVTYCRGESQFFIL